MNAVNATKLRSTSWVDGLCGGYCIGYVVNCCSSAWVVDAVYVLVSVIGNHGMLKTRVLYPPK